MAKQLQLRRGTTTQHSSFTGLVGEVTIDTTKKTVVVHDGSTAGGVPLATHAQVLATNELVEDPSPQLGADLDLNNNDITGTGGIPAGNLTGTIADARMPDLTGEVTTTAGAVDTTIASNIVDEDNLKISNAGTNGQFLSKQSGNTGGLTWAAANQYVHPNHSGEVTSSADGATTIASNTVDEDNLKVSNSPTNGYVLSAQSGNTGGLTWAVPGQTAAEATTIATAQAISMSIALG